MTTYSEDLFEAEFSPTIREFIEDIPKGTPVEHVWTIVEGDFGDLFAAPGYHFVNRLMYVTTERPWPSEDVLGEWMIYSNHPELD